MSRVLYFVLTVGRQVLKGFARFWYGLVAFNEYYIQSKGGLERSRGSKKRSEILWVSSLLGMRRTSGYYTFDLGKTGD
jgi:hypothetical protein